MLSRRTEEETRYDVETLRQVTLLAQQLQEGRRETFTAEQVEAIGEEVGLGRAFVQDALRQVALRRAEEEARAGRAGEFRGLVAGWGLALGWSLLAWAASAALPGAFPAALLLSAAAAAAAGFLAGERRAALRAGGAMALALALLHLLAPGAAGGGAPVAFAAAAPAAAWLARMGARLRERYFPRPAGHEGLPSPALLDLLVAVQRRLSQAAERRAVLSVAVAGARELRRGAPEAQAAGSFAALREWVEEVVRRGGGQCRGDLETGLECVFPTDGGAMGAARELQEGIERFNATRSRLGAPFRLRCGAAAGEVGGQGSLDPLETALVERAAALREQADAGDVLVAPELAAAALLELRWLAPLPRRAGEAPVFSWREGLRARRGP